MPKKEKEKKEENVLIGCDFTIRDLPIITRDKIFNIQEKLSKEMNIKLSKNQVIAFILNEGCNFILTNK